MKELLELYLEMRTNLSVKRIQQSGVVIDTELHPTFGQLVVLKKEEHTLRINMQYILGGA